jgi:hypothetical protein
MKFYLPLLGISPTFDQERVARPPFTLARRNRRANLPDLSTIGAKHKMHFPFQFADALLTGCKMELCIDASTTDEAKLQASRLRLALLLDGTTPFLIPFIASHSEEEYAGISYRDRPSLAAMAPPQMRSGPTSADISVEMWPHELSFSFVYLEERSGVSEASFERAAVMADLWRSLESKHKELTAFRETAESAPMLVSSSQSYLHIWCGLEALFPRVSSELSFRLSLYLAQLVSLVEDRGLAHKRFKASYDIRSRIAHGSRSNLTHDEWNEAWDLLVATGKAIVQRRGLPTDIALLDELLQPTTSAGQISHAAGVGEAVSNDRQSGD